MFHVEISRVRREFLLLTDDREALIELLEGRADGDDGALEAIGIDPGSESPGSSPTGIHSLDERLFAELDRDWRALERRAADDEHPPLLPSRLPRRHGARGGACGAGRSDRRPAPAGRPDAGGAPAASRARARGPGAGRAHPGSLAALARARLDTRRRRHDRGADRAAWRAEAAALAEAAHRRLAADRAGGEGLDVTAVADVAGDRAPTWAVSPGRWPISNAPACSTTEGGSSRSGRSTAIARRRRASPELLGEGYAEVAELGREARGRRGARCPGRGRAGGLARGPRRTGRAGRGGARPAGARGGLARGVPARRQGRAPDPADPARAAWRAEGEALAGLARAMLSPDGAHAPYVDAAPGGREAVARAAGEVADMLDRDRRQGFAWLTREVNREQSGDRGRAVLPAPLRRDGRRREGALRTGGVAGGNGESRPVLAGIRRRGGGAARPDRGLARAGRRAAGGSPAAGRGARSADRNGAGGPSRCSTNRAPCAPPTAPTRPTWTGCPGSGRRWRRRTPGSTRRRFEVEYRETRLLMGEGAGVREGDRRHPLRRARPWRAEGAGGLARRPGRPARDTCARRSPRSPTWTRAARGTGNGWARSSARRARSSGSGAVSTRPRNGVPRIWSGAGQAGRQPGREAWEKKALAVAAEGGAIRAEVPPRQLSAHLAFFGAGPDRVAEEEKKIRERIERDKQAREAAAAAARAAEEARRAEESRRIGWTSSWPGWRPSANA